MKGYKAFDKDMKCRDFQFKEGETYTIDGAISLCSRGFHFCLNPLDILSYYPLVGSLFCEVSADGVSNQKESDSKRVASKITIGARLSIKTMAKAAVNFISDSVNPKDSNAATAGYAANAATAGSRANAATAGDAANAATAGYAANAATAGYAANAATAGYAANAATAGSLANAATAGSRANAATAGYAANAATAGSRANAATAGDAANAATAGYAANAATAGEAANAAAMGPNSIASAIGINSAARGAIGNWIVVAEWLQNKTDYSWAVKSVKTTKVDGKRIKADTFYKLVGGKFVEAE